MKVLLINGSPKEKGCTWTALSEVARGIQEGGVETEIFHIGKGPVRGCIDCRKCKDGSGRCVFDDLVNRALEKAEEADGFVFGSPVYYASANGSMTAFLDRMFYAGTCFAHKPGAAVVSARRAGTTAALDQLNKYFPISGMPLVPSVYWNMVHGHTPEDVAQDLEGLHIMRMLGRNMVWMLQCFQAGKEAGILPPGNPEPVRTNFIR